MKSDSDIKRDVEAELNGTRTLIPRISVLPLKAVS
jgi:hypothetical protein